RSRRAGCWLQLSAFGVESGKAQFSDLCPRKRNYLPILELLPPPALGERCHGSLARRLVAVHAHPKEVYQVEIDRGVAEKICATGISPERPLIREPHDGQRSSVCCRRSSIEYAR